MAAESTGEFPFSDIPTPSYDVLMAHHQKIEDSRLVTQGFAAAFVERPSPRRAKILGESITDWLVCVHDFAERVDVSGIEDPVDLLVEVFFREDRLRVDMLNGLTESTSFETCAIPPKIIAVDFTPDTENEQCLDIDSIDDAFHTAVKSDFNKLEDIVMLTRRGKAARLAHKLKPKVGEAVLEVAKITAGVWLAGKLLGRKNN